MANLDRVAAIIRDVLDRNDLEIGAEDSSDTVEGWDSLAHVRIVLAVEQEFGARFPVEAIAELNSIPALLAALD